MKFYQAIASAMLARANCERSGNAEWFERHTDRILALVRQHTPSGSGFDVGTRIDLDRSRPNRLVFTTEFHHMDDAGYYCGWTSHDVFVTPDLAFGVRIRVTGVDLRDVKGYICAVFTSVANEEVKP